MVTPSTIAATFNIDLKAAGPLVTQAIDPQYRHFSGTDTIGTTVNALITTPGDAAAAGVQFVADKTETKCGIKIWKCLAQVVHVVVSALSSAVTGVDKFFDKMINGVPQIKYPTSIELSHDEQLEGPLEFTMNGNTLTVEGDISFAAQAAISEKLPWLPKITHGLLSCGVSKDDPRPKIHVSIPYTLSWQGDKLNVSRQGWNYSWKVPCNLSALNLSAEQLISVLHLNHVIDAQARKLLDKAPGSMDIDNQAQRAWAALNKPYPVGGNAWVVLQPNSLAISNPTQGSSNTELRFNAAIGAQPYVVIGEQPSPAPIPFPGVSHPDTVPQSDFTIQVEGRAPYDYVEKALNDNFGGTVANFEGHSVRLSNFSFYGSGDRFAFGVRAWPLNYSAEPIFSPKRFGGKAWIIGKLATSEDLTKLYLQDADFTIETKNVLLRGADFVLHDYARRRLQGYAQVSLQRPEVDRLQGLLQHSWRAADCVSVSVNSKLKESLVYPTATEARVRITLHGTLNVSGPSNTKTQLNSKYQCDS